MKPKTKNKIVPRGLPDASQDKRGRQAQRRISHDRNRQRTKRSRSQRSEAAQPLFVEGRRAVAELLESGAHIKRVLVARGSDENLAPILEQLDARELSYELVSRQMLDDMSLRSAHQGIVAELEPISYASLSELIAAAGTGDALIVVLDHVVDEGNLGAIIRSAEVVGAAGVVIAKARAASVGIGAYKTSAGAAAYVPIAQVSNIASALKELKEAGFWVGAATEHAEQLAWDAPLEGRLALVMGSEEQGISQLVRQACDFECKLLQRGKIESLNVAQAATVLCYEWLRNTIQRSKES
ncbi:MAG: 23S rRNA (guanosine(2251)-2'-O)-methyltransferase RlmB [Atopobiaceae bacterium]|nr:23S rRNA (guanosine(2251)-2'-O)-methyltransferase RlmB [Atopobiaceae bacterium]